jgi:hypothetical protein
MELGHFSIRTVKVLKATIEIPIGQILVELEQSDNVGAAEGLILIRLSRGWVLVNPSFGGQYLQKRFHLAGTQLSELLGMQNMLWNECCRPRG